MEFKRKIVSLTAAAVMALSVCAPLGEGFVPVQTAITASAATAAVPAQVTVKDYTSDASSVTLTWNKIKGVTGYRVYQLKNGAYKNVGTITKNATSFKVTGLNAATKYTFKVRAYTKGASGNVWGKSSKAYNTVTAPETSKTAYKITKVKSKTDSSSVTVTWNSVKCDGYIIYLYDCNNDKWVKVADAKSGAATSINLNAYSKAEGQTKLLYNYYCGGLYGYRFGVRPYTTDASATHVVYAKTYKMPEPYYNINTVTEMFAGEYELLCEQLPKAKVDNAPDWYYTYITSKDDKTGAISSTKTKTYVSEASRQAYEKFAKEHFGKSWTDAQKIAYTLNWINKNNVYDKEYKANAGGYFANVTVQKLGQCNSYNGAIAEMLTIMGYKGHYMQCMTPSVRAWQHFRTEIKIDGKTYSFESGETGWLWLFRKYDEVPLSKKATTAAK